MLSRGMTGAAVSSRSNGAWLVRGIAVILAFVCAVSGFWHLLTFASLAGKAEFAVPPSVVALSVAASLVMLVALVGVVLAKRPGVALPALVAAQFWIGDVIAGGAPLSLGGLVTGTVPAMVLSYGALAWLMAVLIVRPRGAGISLLAPVLLSIATAVLAVVSMQPPVVSCGGDSPVYGAPAWLPHPGAGSYQSTPDGHGTGEVQLGDQRYQFECRGNQLVGFSRLR
jgi:hypothetical protein